MATEDKENVVISGLSCRLPQSDNIDEFRDNLMNGVDMVTEDNSRWEPGIHGLPRRNGKIRDLSKFDAAFFGVHPTQANRMDPQLRILLEVSYEAIVDAGVNPSKLRGTKTGVFIGASGSEAQDLWSREPETTQGYTMTGCNRAMLSNRLSFYFDFNGPSYTIDTACSSSLLALDQAVKCIRTGECDAAIVGGSHLCLQRAMSVQFMRLGMLSPDGKCRSFDANGQGYVRSEGIVVLYIQKESISKRIYCTVLNSKTNSDGHKEQGITFPSGERQKELLNAVYNEISLDPSQVAYVEAHGTGTKAGDPVEVNTICDVFCKERTGPLKIGSVKSNMGHAEPASGLAAVAKVIISMENMIIPGNIHFDTPNPSIPGLTNGKLQVICRQTSWQPDLVGVNSFGFGGSNVHAILQANKSARMTDVVDSNKKRLFIYSSRTESGLKDVLEMVSQTQSNLNLHALLNETAHTSQSWQTYRGFTILNGSGKHFVQKVPVEQRQVWYVFAGMGTQWNGMARDMMEIDRFRTSIMQSSLVLKTLDIDLFDILMNGDVSTYENPINSFVTIAAIQVALVDVLDEVGIQSDGIVGHSVGELGCAYADGCLSAEETVLAAYWRGHCIKSTNLPPGAMAAVGLTWKEAQDRCTNGVMPACHNAKDTVTISGPKEAIKSFVTSLKAQNIFAKEVNSSGVAFHSHYMGKVAPELQQALSKIISTPKKRSSKWISSSIPSSQWNSELAKYSSADYHVNNLVSPVLFQEALQHVPDNALVIEIAPHCLLQATLKRTLSPNCCIVGLMSKKETDNVEYVLTALGKCFQNGVNLDPLKLVQGTRFPVPPGTPIISPHIKWDHSQTWDVPSERLSDTPSRLSKRCNVFEINMDPDSEDSYLTGHKIDGRVLFPATGYLTLAWKALAEMENTNYEDMSVEFEEINLLRATILPLNGKVTFEVTVMPGTGHFEITEGGSVTTTGRVVRLDASKRLSLDAIRNETSLRYNLTSQDVYTLFRVKGYQYSDDFQGIVKCDMSAQNGTLKWTGNWVTFTDTMLQMIILSTSGNSLRLPTRIRSVIIDLEMHKNTVLQTSKDNEDTFIKVQLQHSLCVAGGVSISGLYRTTTAKREDKKPYIVESFKFVPYITDEPVAVSPELKLYAEACHELAIRIGGKQLNGQVVPSGTPKTKQTSTISPLKRNTLKSQSFEGESFTYLKFLKSLLSSKLEEIEIQKASSAFDRNSLEQTECLFNILTQSEWLKACLDIVIENTQVPYLRILEVKDTGMKTRIEALAVKYPILPIKCTIAKSRADEHSDRTEFGQLGVLDWSPNEKFSNSVEPFHFTLLNNVLHKQTNITTSLENITNSVDSGGFILVHERTHNFHLMQPLDDMHQNHETFTETYERSSNTYFGASEWREIFSNHGLNVIFERRDPFLSTLFLLRRSSQKYDFTKQMVLDISDKDCKWVEDMKRELYEAPLKSDGGNLWLWTDNSISGVIGMVTSIRKEPDSSRIRCLVGSKEGNNNPISILSSDGHKDLVQNVYKNGLHGSYRQIPHPNEDTILTCHAYVDVLTSGDLSSLKWIQTNMGRQMTTSKKGLNILASKLNRMLCCFKPNRTSLPKICTIHFASLNFRDIMLATGKLSVDAIPKSFVQGDCKLGMEFSGIDNHGRAVMGLLPAQGLATEVEVPNEFLWLVPLTWSLEQAATVPVVYTTAYYALVVRGNIQTRDKVLIHSGSGGMGQAAIAIALQYNCEVFITVGSQEKRDYLIKRFPQLRQDHFFSSRNTAFEKGVLNATSGRGVDIVLNSLAEEKLQASIRVLAQHGKFLEIGKVDLSQNSALGMSIFMKNITFHGILLDALFETNNKDFERVSVLLQDGIKQGTVRPLKYTMFGKDDIEQAFRYMAQGKHIGKVLIEIKDLEGRQGPQEILALRRTFFDPDKCYIIAGGLGGFGLELSHWMAERGAKHLLLTSRSGVKTGYQALKLNMLKDRGVKVQISKHNISKQDEVNQLFYETEGKEIGGIFNLAAVLLDGLLENQSIDSFQRVCEPKIKGTANLDMFSRQFCPAACDWFVVFSSFVSGGYGNAGQSNYAFANSAMERICEKRKEDGLPGKAIQWGGIGDVGILLDTLGHHTTDVVGTVPQSITSCLSALDQLLNQSESVVSCYITADKEALVGDQSERHIVVDVVETMCRLLGFNNVDAVNRDVPFSDLGLDSLVGVEVKQTLERSFDINLTMREIRHLTVNSLRKMAEKGSKTHDQMKKLNPMEAIMSELIPNEIIVKLNDITSNDIPLYIIHPIDGTTRSLELMAALIKVPVFGVQCTPDVPKTSAEDMASFYLKTVSNHNTKPTTHLAGYSVGACIATEMVRQLCSQDMAMLTLNHIKHEGMDTSSVHFNQTPGFIQSLLLMEGSHKSAATYADVYKNPLDLKNLEHPENGHMDDHEPDVFFNTKYNIVKTVLKSNPVVTLKDVNNFVQSYYQKIFDCAVRYRIESTINKGAVLIKAEHGIAELVKLDDDFGLSEVFSGGVEVHVVPGDHITFQAGGNESHVADIINSKLTEIQRIEPSTSPDIDQIDIRL